jgi:hypothetical protein
VLNLVDWFKDDLEEKFHFFDHVKAYFCFKLFCFLLQLTGNRLNSSMKIV